MSFILDALRRSERARRVLGAPPTADAAPSTMPARRAWAIGAVALLLAVNGALLAWTLWRDTTPGPVAPAAATASTATAADVAPTAGPAVPIAAPSPGVRSLAREAGATATELDGEPQLPPAVALADAGATLRARLAPLHLDAHGWSEDPASRFVIVNLKRRVVGDALAPGVTLVAIEPDGAIVDVEGQRILLPRQ